MTRKQKFTVGMTRAVEVEYAPQEIDGQPGYKVELYFKETPNFRLFCTYQRGCALEPIHGADISPFEDEVMDAVEAQLFRIFGNEPEVKAAHAEVERLRAEARQG